MIYLSLEDLLEIHRQILAETGGLDGVRDVPLLDSAVGRPQASFGGVDLYSSLSEKAATLLHSIICNHPFVDGNKRTGFSAMDVFLRMNDCHLVATEDEKYDFVQGVASRKFALVKIHDWIKRRIRHV